MCFSATPRRRRRRRGIRPPSVFARTETWKRARGRRFSCPARRSEVQTGTSRACAVDVAFEAGRDRRVFLVVASRVKGACVSSSALLVEPIERASSRGNVGVVRAVAPLAGCRTEIDASHRKWLHARVRSPQSCLLASRTRTRRTRRRRGGGCDGDTGGPPPSRMRRACASARRWWTRARDTSKRVSNRRRANRGGGGKPSGRGKTRDGGITRARRRAGHREPASRAGVDH